MEKSDLAAQSGVCYSLEKPHSDANSNLTGFLNLLEGYRHHGWHPHVRCFFLVAYSANTRIPFRTTDTVAHPISLNAATKKAN